VLREQLTRTSKPERQQELHTVKASVVTPDQILQLGHAFRGAKALLSAVELNLFTALAKGPLDAQMLRARIGIAERGARDFFDSLVALGMLERDSMNRYANSPAAALYLDRDKSTYLGDALDFLNARQFRPWGSLTEALRTGSSQNGERGRGDYSSYYADPSVLENVVKGMTASTQQVAKSLAEQFPWRDYKTMIDVGTAQGCLPVRIAGKHTHITAGGFDLPPTKTWFDRYVAEQGLTDRVRFHPGDFFRDPIPNADVIVMGRVLHNWDIATKKMLLIKAHDALPVGGALIVYERLIDDARRVSASGLLSSLNMLVMTAGGFDFSAADCIGWMREVGYRDMRVEMLTTDQSMVIALKHATERRPMKSNSALDAFCPQR
jgi:O-methyltransferase domain/Dimerisation domain